MIRRPPRSTLFPTRRSSDLSPSHVAPSGYGRPGHTSVGVIMRSEEHTSELQSHVNLVCRLLLEKKKNTNLDASEKWISSNQHDDSLRLHPVTLDRLHQLSPH